MNEFKLGDEVVYIPPTVRGRQRKHRYGVVTKVRSDRYVVVYFHQEHTELPVDVNQLRRSG